MRNSGSTWLVEWTSGAHLQPEQVTAATLGLALSRLGSGTPAAGLMRLLAFLAPEPVPLDLLLAGQDKAQRLGAKMAGVLGPLLDDPVVLADAVAALRRYSLATAAGDGLVQVHRLVQAITRAQLTVREAGEWKQTSAAVVEAAVPADARLPGTWPAFAVLLPQAWAILDLASDGMSQIAHYLGYSGSVPAARNLFSQIADAYRDSKDFGPDHPATLDARRHLAHWTGEAGDAVGACDQLALLLPITERVLGPDHPHTLDARRHLARWSGEAGDATAARDQFAALLPISERVLGPDHPQTLGARNSLAHWSGEAGDRTGARDQFAAVLPIAERVLGPGHPQTLGARHNLARWTGEAGGARPVRRHGAHRRNDLGSRPPGAGLPADPRPCRLVRTRTAAPAKHIGLIEAHC